MSAIKQDSEGYRKWLQVYMYMYVVDNGELEIKLDLQIFLQV